jgi:transcriptional regulator with XRE-family HTH domain
MKAKTAVPVERPRAARRQDDGFGARIRRMRKEAGLTLQELSGRCGLAPSTISKVEQNQISPTYENILRLADGLGLEVGELFTKDRNGSAPGRRSVTRAGRGLSLETAQYDYELLCTDLSHKHFTPLLATVRARSFADFSDYVRHDGEEFIFVVSGTARLETEFYEPLLLGAGDSCYFDSRMGHACISTGDTPAVVLWVTSRDEPRALGELPNAAVPGQSSSPRTAARTPSRKVSGRNAT